MGNTLTEIEIEHGTQDKFYILKKWGQKISREND